MNLSTEEIEIAVLSNLTHLQAYQVWGNTIVPLDYHKVTETIMHSLSMQKRNKETYTNKNFLAEEIARLMEERGYCVEDLEHIYDLLGKHSQVIKN